MSESATASGRFSRASPPDSTGCRSCSASSSPTGDGHGSHPAAQRCRNPLRQAGGSLGHHHGSRRRAVPVQPHHHRPETGMVATLQLNDVGIRYGKREVLSGITTPALKGGEVTAVIGPNAAGKSSLFRRIAGLLAGPGDIAIDGVPERSKSRICYMPQDTSVNTVLTVYESILLAHKQGADPRVGDADLEAVDAVLG